MLTLEQCRKYLGEHESKMSDQEVEELKDLLYQLANVLVDGFLMRDEEDKHGNSETNRSQ